MEQDSLFKRTEYVLYNYKGLEIKIKNLEIDIEELENNYTGVTGVSYAERVGPTNKFSSSVENEVISREENEEVIIARLKANRDYSMNLKKKIDNALETLSPDEQRLIVLRYFNKPKRTWLAIANDMHIDKDSCCRMKNSVVNRISNLIYNY